MWLLFVQRKDELTMRIQRHRITSSLLQLIQDVTNSSNKTTSPKFEEFFSYQSSDKNEPIAVCLECKKRTYQKLLREQEAIPADYPNI